MNEDEALDLPMERAMQRDDEFTRAVDRYVVSHRDELLEEMREWYAEGGNGDEPTGQALEDELEDRAALSVAREDDQGGEEPYED